MRKALLILALIVFFVTVPSGALWWAFTAEEAMKGQAFREGWDAGGQGIPVEACPYYDQSTASAWKRGWVEGYKQWRKR
jgi:ribosome modulation factor